jgi:hypothetical protein
LYKIIENCTILKKIVKKVIANCWNYRKFLKIYAIFFISSFHIYFLYKKLYVYMTWLILIIL